MITFIIIWWCILGMLAIRILIVSNTIEVQKIFTQSGYTHFYRPRYGLHFLITAYSAGIVCGLVLLLLVLHGVEDKNFKFW